MDNNNDILETFDGVNDMRIAKSTVVGEKCGEWIYSIMRIIIKSRTVPTAKHSHYTICKILATFVYEFY